MSNWEEYSEYQYPHMIRSPRVPPISGDTIIRAPKRRVVTPSRRLPCYCLDRCHHSDISTTPMFRPFDLTEDFSDHHLADLDHPTSRDDYKIEIIKSDDRTVRGASSIIHYNTSEASSFRKDGYIYYRLRHGDEYKVRMINNTRDYVNALLKIDSDTMGKWRVSPYSSVTVERPVHNSRKFVFVREASDEAREGGVRQGSQSDSNGLVEVTFIPMIDKRPDSQVWNVPLMNSSNVRSVRYGGVQNYSVNSRGLQEQRAMDTISESNSNKPLSANNYQSGATILGEDSDQTFLEASRYFVEDKEMKVVKRIRIVIDNRSKYASIRDRDDGYTGGHRDDPVPPRIQTFNSR